MAPQPPDSAAAWARELASADGNRPQQLLQHLYALQRRYAHVPPAAQDQLASSLGLTRAEVSAVVDFYAFLHHGSRGDYDLLLSDCISGRLQGSQALYEDLARHLGVAPGSTRADGRVSLGLTSCTGMCDQGPALLVNGLALTRLDGARCAAIAELVEAGTPLSDWPRDWFRVDDQIRRRDLLLASALEPGRALAALFEQGPERLLGELESANLRGRGGAGFCAPRKWQACRQTPSQQRVVVCNADEGEPGTFKDRVLLSTCADELIEGMTLCAGCIGADRGFIYLRGEYRYLLPQLEAALQHRRRSGLLGRAIAGRAGFDFDIEIHLGAGAYVCGEESALLESLEGRRGIPRKRPPFPTSSGYLGLPTVVNNVETLVAAAQVAVHGADWFRAVGSAESAGSKLLSISGDCARPGVYEYPFGVSLARVLADCGGTQAQAVQLSGPAGQLLRRQEFERRLGFEDLATGGSLIVFGPGRDLLDAVQNFAHFFAHESCGFCTPCRVGTVLLRDLVDKFQAGRGGQPDLEQMRRIGELMQATSHCGLGQTAPNPVLDSLRAFPEIYRERLGTEGFGPAFDLDQALAEARELRAEEEAS
jgi:[NiFe] hydrogenase diaphorase moiety large subunit